jgi:spore coat polysaccharide biosynthesis predicted glycosyltransferase SpsG/CMP-N-acetylneuraminic acid synthetase
VKDGLRVVAVVPARGGTDRVPYLNIKRLGDRPLLAHTLDAARAAQTVDRVVVSTDDAAVADAAKACGAEVPFLRPRELAAEINSLMPVVQHALQEIERHGDRPDVVVLLQATTPFRDARAIDAAVARLVEGGFDSVVSVTEDRTLAWKDERGLLVPLFEKAGPREKQPPIYKENGAVVAMRRAAVDASTRFGGRVGYLVLDKRSGLTVHDLEDFWMAERLLRQPRILFRADGGRRIGMGHVYRSLAIADALVQGSQAEAAFLMSGEHAEGIATVSKAGYPVRVASDARLETQLQHIRDFAPAILINDLQTLDDAYLRALSHLGCTTVNLVDTLDDLEVTEHYKQVIVSVMHAERETPEGFYGGPEFAILRSHFQGRPKELRERPRLLLLSFGGSDPQGLTLLGLRAARELPDSVEVVAVTGPAFADQKRLEALLADLPRKPRLIHAAPGGHIADLMQEADVVVCSGGMSVYEIAALGTPGIVLGQNAREDERMRAFAEKGTVQYLGLGTEVSEAALRQAILGLLGDTARRRAMSQRGRALVDGMGAARTAELVLGEERRREAALSTEGR